MSVVLVVDDAIVDQKIAGGLLEASGMFQVVYADGGAQAMEAIDRQRPDVVLTDLQMPDVDGLQLVTSIADRYPDIPVVLMTAYGSENVAAESLASGAASFVPKTMLAEHLLATIMQVLATYEAEAKYRRLASCATKTDFEFCLLNELDLIDPLVDMIQEIACSHGFCGQRDRAKLGVALEAALANAMVRGNLEMTREEFPVATPEIMSERAALAKYVGRRVHFRASITPEVATFVIRDDGPGFDVATVCDNDNADATSGEAGRGLMLMNTLLDEVTFNEQGNEITLVYQNH
ncbi:response regulator [Mariniblastus sp.]|nr:response regulator [Mariniblastus sp.]